MPQKLLAKIVDKQDVSENLRMLVAGEKSARVDFAFSQPYESMWIKFDDSVDYLTSVDHSWVKAESSDDIRDLLAYLKHSTSPEAEEDDVYKPTFVFLDSVEQLQRMLFAERLVQQNRDYIKGDDYNWMASMMGAIFKSFDELNINFIAFTGLRSVTNEGESLTVVPAVFGSFSEQVQEYVDYSICLEYAYVVEEISEDLEVTSRPQLRLIACPNRKYPWVFDPTNRLLTAEVTGSTLNDILASRQEYLDTIGEESVSFDLTMPDDDDKVELPKGMSRQDKIQKLLDKGAPTNKETKENK